VLTRQSVWTDRSNERFKLAEVASLSHSFDGYGDAGFGYDIGVYIANVAVNLKSGTIEFWHFQGSPENE
jgi:hypothetical protein